MVEKNKVKVTDEKAAQGIFHDDEHQLPSYVELALNILKKSGSSPANTLTIEEHTTLHKYANWCVNHQATQIEHYKKTALIYSRKQASAIFGISLPTLDKYVRAGLIQSENFGKKILFSERAIQEATQCIEAIKYQHINKK